MFDRLAWRRELYERYLVDLDDEEESDDEPLPLPEGEAPFHSWTP